MSAIPRRETGRDPSRPASSRRSAFSGTLLVFALLCPAAAAEGIRWRSDYGRALKEATERGVPLFLNVGTENCFWCKQLDAKTFSDDEAARLLNERCIPVKVDANTNDYLVKALKVQAYPPLIFASHDGSILGYREGFMEARAFKEQLGKVLAAVGTPDWMQRDFEAAGKAVMSADFVRALSLLRGVVEDGKSRPLQVRARKMLADLERQAADKVEQARQLATTGKTMDALAILDEVKRVYAGTAAVLRSRLLHHELAVKAGDEQRKQQAGELLRQAQEDYKSRQYLCCLDRCEQLTTRFADLPEMKEAERMAGEIKDNPEWTKTACDQLSERMCVLYLALADALVKKGQPQQAIHYLERVTKLFPGSKHAEQAGGKLARLRGAPLINSDRK